MALQIDTILALVAGARSSATARGNKQHICHVFRHNFFQYVHHCNWTSPNITFTYKSHYILVKWFRKFSGERTTKKFLCSAKLKILIFNEILRFVDHWWETFFFSKSYLLIASQHTHIYINTNSTYLRVAMFHSSCWFFLLMTHFFFWLQHDNDNSRCTHLNYLSLTCYYVLWQLALHSLKFNLQLHIII